MKSTIAFVRPTRVTRPEGDYTELTYDARGPVALSGFSVASFAISFVKLEKKPGEAGLFINLPDDA